MNTELRRCCGHDAGRRCTTPQPHSGRRVVDPLLDKLDANPRETTFDCPDGFDRVLVDNGRNSTIIVGIVLMGSGAVTAVRECWVRSGVAERPFRRLRNAGRPFVSA